MSFKPFFTKELNVNNYISINGNGVSVGSNVVVNANSVVIGNSTVNSVSNSTSSVIANSTGSSVTSSNNIKFITSAANSILGVQSLIFANTTATVTVDMSGINVNGTVIANTSGVFVGANVALTPNNQLKLGTSTINASTYTGQAYTANLATTALQANNSSYLGGVGPGSYAVWSGGTFSGQVNISYGSPYFVINSTNTGQRSSLIFNSNGVAKWEMFKNTDDSFFLWDTASGYNPIFSLNGITSFTGKSSIYLTANTITVLSSDGVNTNLTSKQWTNLFANSNVNFLQSDGTNTTLGGATTGVTYIRAASGKEVLASDGSSIFMGRGTTGVLQFFANTNKEVFWSNGTDLSIGYGATGTVNCYRPLSCSSTITASGEVTAFSDPKLKEKFTKINKPFKILDQIEGGTFRWKKGIKVTKVKSGKKDYGILADQVEKVMPEIVYEYETEGEKFKTVAYDKLIPVLIEAIKELKSEIEVLKKK